MKLLNPEVSVAIVNVVAPVTIISYVLPFICVIPPMPAKVTFCPVDKLCEPDVVTVNKVPDVFAAAETVALTEAETDSTIPLAPDAFVTVSPVVSACANFVLKCVNAVILNKPNL